MTFPIPASTCGNWIGADLDGCQPVPDGIPPEMRQRYVAAASQYLWIMTGRRLGPSCSIAVRPCKKTCADGYGILSGRFLNQGQYQSTGAFIPYMRDGLMYNASICGCAEDCHCGPELCQIELAGPIYDIQTVDIGGVTVNPLTYKVMDGRFLTRIASQSDPTDDDCWPACQDLGAASKGPNTFTVFYRTGLQLPELATLAAASLASHFMQGCANGCGCGAGTRENLKSLSRQGVNLEFADAQQVFTDGRTGIEIVDFFIQSYGLKGVKSPMRVLSPDHKPQRTDWYAL